MFASGGSHTEQSQQLELQNVDRISWKKEFRMRGHQKNTTPLGILLCIGKGACWNFHRIWGLRLQLNHDSFNVQMIHKLELGNT